MKVATLCGIGFLAVLAGCNGGGGGGGDSAPAAQASTATFPLAKGNADAITNGGRYSLTFSGTMWSGTAPVQISGSAVESQSSAAPATYKGAPALSVTMTRTGSITGPDGKTAQFADTEVAYYNASNYMLLAIDGGMNSTHVVTSGFTGLPSSVKVGDTATIGSYDTYTDNTLKTKKETCQVSFVIEPRDETTAIVNVIDSCKDVKNGDENTTQDRKIIDTFGKVTPLTSTLSERTAVATITYQ